MEEMQQIDQGHRDQPLTYENEITHKYESYDQDHKQKNYHSTQYEQQHNENTRPIKQEETQETLQGQTRKKKNKKNKKKNKKNANESKLKEEENKHEEKIIVPSKQDLRQPKVIEPKGVVVMKQIPKPERRPIGHPVEDLDPPPPLVAVVYPASIMREAEKERMGSILVLFKHYVVKYSKYLQNHEIVLHNIAATCQIKKNFKEVTSYLIRDYFSHIATMSENYHSKSYKFAREQFKQGQSQNPLLNMRVDLKPGVDEFAYLRKVMGNDFEKFSHFVKGEVLGNIHRIFDTHKNTINQIEGKLQISHHKYITVEKEFRRVLAKVIVVYSKGEIGEEQDEDAFVQMAKFVKSEIELREAMTHWGTAMIQFRKSNMEAELVLFEQLQQIFNEYKGYLKTMYSGKNPMLRLIKMTEEVKEEFKFANICAITDLDYINYVFDNNEKGKAKRQLSNRDFERFFTMEYFPIKVGKSSQLLKGTTSKQYELKKENTILVNTIGGNLVQFNKNTVELEQKFSIKNIVAKIVSNGVVQINEEIKKLYFFASQRTIRVVFKDADRAEELIAFLHQEAKQQTQPVPM